LEGLREGEGESVPRQEALLWVLEEAVAVGEGERKPVRVAREGEAGGEGVWVGEA
jgi:hypothetical protein